MLEGGFHLILDLEGCKPRVLDSPSAMLGMCRRLADILGSRVVAQRAHRFRPRGVTAFVVIAESHVSVHTWPESGKAFLDLFCCKEHLDVDRILDFIQGTLGVKRGRVTLLLRESLLSRLLYTDRRPVASLQLDFGRPIYAARSPYQTIELTRGPMGLSLFLDGYWQFVEQYEHIYHETLVHPALACAPRLRRIGIGGGGDGLALREIVRYPDLGRVWMYELDPRMIELARSHPEMVRVNRRALDHPRASVVAADARKMLDRHAPFDVLIFDFPSISDGRKFTPLYDTPIYRRARRALAPGGVLVTQVTDFPWHLERTRRNLERVFRHVLPIQTTMRDSVFSFIIASNRPLRQRRPLPTGLRFLRQGTLDSLLAPARLAELIGVPARRNLAAVA